MSHSLPTREGATVRWSTHGSAAKLVAGEWRWVDRNERVPRTYLDNPEFEVLDAGATRRNRFRELYATAKTIVDDMKAGR